MEEEKDKKIAELEYEIAEHERARKISAWIQIIGTLILMAILTYGLLKLIFK